MPFDFRDVKPGDPISARAWNDMGHAIRDGWRVLGDGVNVRNSGHGLEISVPQPEEMDFRITGGPDGAGGYDWVRVTHDTPDQWVTTAITGGHATGDPVYPRQYGLPKPHGRVLVLIPPLRRVGNYLHAGKAWLSVGLGLKLEADDAVYHAVRADGSSQWVFDALRPELETTSDERVYVCCHSSSETSTSDGCPTNACGACDGPAACQVTVQISSALTGPSFSNPVCNGLFGTFTVRHKSKCTWILQSPEGITITLYWSGSQWTLECVITGDTGSGIAVYRGPSYDCRTTQPFYLDEAASTCVCSIGVGQCDATVTPEGE